MSRPRADLYSTCTACNYEVVEGDKVYHVGKASVVTEKYWDWNGQQYKKEIRLDRRAGHGKVVDIFCEDCYTNFVETIKSLKVVVDVLAGEVVTID